jgi:WD40 repeat protein
MSEKDSPLSPTGDGIPELPMLTSPARTRFASLVRAAVLMRRSTAGATPALMLTSPARQRTASSSRFPTMGPVGVKTSRLAALTPKLRSLEPTQDLAAHQALVRHLQFSPDGKYLATSSWDRTSVIFRVGVCMERWHCSLSDWLFQEPFKQYRVLAHPQGFVGQVAW